MRNHPSRAVLLGLVALVLLGSSCTRRADGAVSGEKVDACDGIRLVNSLDPPKPDDGDAIEQYASDSVKVLDNVNPRFKYKDQKGDSKEVPREVLDDVAWMEQRMRSFRDEVAAANKLDQAGARQAALDAAASGLADDERHRAVDRNLQDFLVGRCG